MKALSNLNGFFLCPFQLLIDVNEQLARPGHDIKKMAFTPICELNSTNDWINLEALGNPTALRAKQMCKLLNMHFQTEDIQSLELHILLADGHLGSDNLFALLFLNQQLPTLKLHFYVNEGCEAFLAASLNSLAEEDKLKYTIHHDQHDFEEKAEQLLINRRHIAQKAGFALSEQWLSHSEWLSSQQGLIIGYAWSCLKTGAYDPGCRALQEILKKSDITEAAREVFFMHLQLVRFLSHQYKTVTEETFPDSFSHIKDNDLTNLYFIKAYSATLSRNLMVADVYFKKARINPDMPITDEASLYQLNLHALFLVLKGDVDLALTCEINIKEHINQHHINTLGLRYVNFINIARVYKKIKRYDESLKYYEKAYQEIMGGGFTTSDNIYYNMNLGGLYEAAGHPQKAFYFWVKAALHWLTFGNPYALSWRPRIILSRETTADILKPLSTEKVHVYLLDKINRLMTETGIDLKTHSSPDIQFISAANDASITACHLADDIILYRCEHQHNEASITSAKANLQHLLSDIIRQSMDLTDENITLLVDGSHENFYPESEEDLMLLSAMTGCEKFYFQGECIDFHQQQTSQFFNESHVRLSKTIHQIEPSKQSIKLNYNRSFLNKTLNQEDEIRLVQKISNEKIVNVKNLNPVSTDTIKNLISQKVIQLAPAGTQ